MKIVTGIVGVPLEQLAGSLTQSVAALSAAEGIAAAAVAALDAEAERFELLLATRAGSSARQLIAAGELAALEARLGEAPLLVPVDAATPQLAVLPRPFSGIAARTHVFLPLRDSAGMIGFLYLATSPGSTADAQECAAELATLQPVIAQALQRKHCWERLREVADCGAIASGGSVFDWAAHLLAAALKADVAYVGRVHLDFAATVTTLAASDGRRKVGGFSYPLVQRAPDRRRRHDPRYPPRASDAATGGFRPPSRADDLHPGEAWLQTSGLQSWRGMPLYGGTGQMLGVVAVMFHGPLIDLPRVEATLRLVSERVSAELRRVVAEEERAGLSAVVEAMTDLVATVRPSGYVTHINPAGRHMLGLADGAEPAALRLGTLLSTKPEAESLSQHVLDDADTRGSWSENGVLERIDGDSSVDVTRLVLPIRDGKGHTGTYAVVIRDISERKRQEAQLLQTITALAQSESLLDGVVNNSSAMIYVKDRNGVYLLVSDRFQELTGLVRDEILGKTDDDLFSPEIAANHRARDRHIFSTGEPIQIEEHRDGPLGARVFLTTKFPLRERDGTIYAVCGMSTDITERKRAEHDKQELEAKLRQAQRMESIGRLSGGIAHDFNNILAAILGYAELARMEADSNAATQALLDEIVAASLRARDLVAQLLAFSRRSEPAADAIAVAPVVTEVANMLRSTLPATLTIGIVLAQDLPAVRISPVQLHQILMNLGINAHDAMSGSGRLDIRVVATEVAPSAGCASCHRDFHGRFVRFSVRDNGEGIRDEDLPRLFEPFFTTKEVGHGTGLGLAVLHGIVHSVGGHVEVASQAGAGSEFHVYLPALPPAQIAESEPGTAQETTDPLAARVLLVDDEAQIVAYQRLLFEGAGCTVTAFTDAPAALEALAARPADFDVVVTDHTMPAVTGVELARQVARLRPDLPVILCTGHLSEAVDEGAHAAGIRTVLEKPTRALRLLRAVREALA